MGTPPALSLLFLVTLLFSSDAVAGRPKPPLPTDFKGLAFYLSFDDADEIADAVSKKKPRVSEGASRVEGVRGQAVRLAHPGGDDLPIIDLLPFRHLLTRPLGRGFTVAGWVRHGDGPGLPLLALTPLDNESVPLYWVTDKRGIAVFLMASHGRYAPNYAKRFIPEKGKWVHLALTWDGRDQALLYVDGQPTEWSEPVKNKRRTDLSWLPIEKFGLGAATMMTGEFTYRAVPSAEIPKRATMDLDEFCIFSRPLSEAEVKGLAGRGPVPPQDKVNPDPILGPHLVPPVPTLPGIERSIDWSRVAAVWPFTDAVFDPNRKMLWTVGPDRVSAPLARGVLRRYSYPGFEPKGAYPLALPAYKLAIDSRRGRLAVALNLATKFTGGGTPWAPWDGSRGPVHVYEFDDLPYNPASPQQLKPWRTVANDVGVKELHFSTDGSGLFVLQTHLDPNSNACMYRYGIGGTRVTALAIPDLRSSRLAVRPDGKGFLGFGTYQAASGVNRPSTWPLVQLDGDGTVTSAGSITPAPDWMGWSDLAVDGDEAIWVSGEKGLTRYKRPARGQTVWVLDGSFESVGTPTSFFFVQPRHSKLVLGWGHGTHVRTFVRTTSLTDPSVKPTGPYKDPQDIHQSGYAWPTPDGKYLLYRNGGVYELPK